MSTTVAVNTYAHTATYIAGKILLTLKEIVRESGLDPAQLGTSWKSLEEAAAFYLRAQQLRSLTLEVYPASLPASLAGRWDLELTYSTGGGDDGSFGTDTTLIRYSIAKAGLQPQNCGYRFVMSVAPGSPDFPGWGPTKFLSTDNFTRYSVGSQIGAPGAKVEAVYWVKK